MEQETNHVYMCINVYIWLCLQYAKITSATWKIRSHGFTS